MPRATRRLVKGSYLALQVKQELAAGELNTHQIAAKHGLTANTVQHFGQAHAHEINEMRNEIQDGTRASLLGVAIADKSRRIHSYDKMARALARQIMDQLSEGDARRLAGLIQQWALINHNAAEEIGQIPDRPSLDLSNEAMVEYLINVDKEALT